uniref:hypothetical protein n=1 Tax=Pachymeniopsis lanceolata TaxID=151733 RepID=UPI002A81A17F|nr:hypothetical protein UYL67_pgp016 [Pachymeniopsis lanceolata]WOL37322.1 hypothetical protein [Pachymeniopsis lanceolata]
MNFIQFSFSNAYIYSPNTWLHTMPTSHKLLITFSLLSFIPYFNLPYLIIIVLVVLITIKTLKFHENHYSSCYGILITTILCLLPYNFNYSNHHVYRKIQINFPYEIQFFFKKNKLLKKLISIYNQTLFRLYAPSFIVKLGILSILHCIIIKTLLLTTMYENIILLICTYIKINNYYIRRTILISSFASQFLEQMTRYIQIIDTSIKLRNIKSMIFINKLSISYYLITKFLSHLKHNIYQLSSVLYSKEFNNEYFTRNNILTHL